jgi:hypothetical protein
MAMATAALAQKQGGVLRVFHRDSPASVSILEEGSISAIMPMMGVFNNLVLFDQHVSQNRVESIVPDLATSWLWSEDGTELSFKLREGVRWHDGNPFTAADVKCTYDLLTGKAMEKLPQLPRSLVSQYRRGHHQWRKRSDLPSEAPPTRPDFIACLRLFGDLSVPRFGTRDAQPSDRHRAVQIRRVQTQPVYQGSAKPELLEASAALSRRHRIHHHPEPFDRNPRLRRRQIRHDLPVRGVGPARQGSAQPSPAGDLRSEADERQGQSPRHRRAVV